MSTPAYFDTEVDAVPFSEWTYEELMGSNQDELLSEALRRRRPIGRLTEDHLEAEKAFQPVSREQRLNAYLADLRDRGRIDGYTALIAWRAWRALRKATRGSLRVPNASPGDEDQVHFSWNEGEHHMELDVFPDGRTEFFYRNRSTGKLWDHDQLEDEPIPADVVKKAALFPRT
jgi:hypothetical protein